MPELPEVEARLLYLKRVALGRTIVRVKLLVPSLVKSPSSTAFTRGLRGRRMVNASRRGKYLIISLDNERSLILHFGMGGDLVYGENSTRLPAFTRIVFELDRGCLAFTCPRKICRVMLVDSIDQIPALREMGPEPLAQWRLADLEKIIERSPRSQIKPLLMNQRRIAGVGNIYADQILFEAGVRPDRKASTLSEQEIKRIHSSTRRVLRSALKTAAQEEFPTDFLTSIRESEEGCVRCGSSIQRIRIAGRTAHYCPSCQA